MQTEAFVASPAVSDKMPAPSHRSFTHTPMPNIGVCNMSIHEPASARIAVPKSDHEPPTRNQTQRDPLGQKITRLS